MDEDLISLIKKHGKDILNSDKMLLEKRYMQHGNVSIYEHSLKVAYLSLKIAKRFNINIDERSLVRGALLHDYFLYDWHKKSYYHKKHAWRHASIAYKNASKDFKLNKIEKDIILKHMFPVNIKLPKYKESYIVSIADKISATKESFVLSTHLIEELCGE